MNCYNCKAQIDDDSLYCDQCGERIYLCPGCRIPGKGEGKRCGKCGTALVAAGTSAQEQPKPAAPTRLVCHEMADLTLDLTDGALIGRAEGPYASKLASLKFISARHATLKKDGDRWIIADVGSRNGTAVNGQWCFSPLPFGRGDIVRIGNSYDFIAE